ncbi:MAG: hypothetical protein IPL32_03990 [Chloracidobacterium sp.]|nr:hypothetical protein [Chloracidobacterium sp.]
MPNPILALKSTINISALTRLIKLIVEKKGVVRIASLFLIYSLLLSGLFIAPVQVAKSSSRPPVQAPFNLPPEPFNVNSPSSRMVPTVLATEILSSFTNLFSKSGVREDFALPKPPSLIEKLSSTTSSLFAFIAPRSKPAIAARPESALSVSMANTTAYDFDGDGKSDIGRWHPANHTFEIKRSSDGETVATSIGYSSSVPVPGDYDGDGTWDVAVFTAGTWNIIGSSEGPITLTLGITGDIPVSADYDGDRKTDPAVYNPSSGLWQIEASIEPISPIDFGEPGDIPIPGNYSGDTAANLAFFRPLTGDWHWRTTGSTNVTTVHWGAASHIPLQGDFDGDIISDLVVYAPSNGAWHVLTSSSGFQESLKYFIWGSYKDQPAPADYDGDGRTDYCVWRPTTGVWHTYFRPPDQGDPGQVYGSGNYEYQTLGVPGDRAIPASYVKQIGGSVTGYELATARLAPKNATGGTNLYSQNFSWGTSLVSLPGRSGLNAGFGIGYNSLVWLKNGSAMYFDADTSNVTPGFRFGFPVIEPVYFDSAKGIWAYMMVTPDGGRKEFRQQGASNYFETADSSYTQLKILGTETPNSPVEDITMTVTTTDGTQMSYVWSMGAYKCTQIKDRNGNYISIAYDGNGLMQTVTDTLGRVITVNYDSGHYPISITQTWQSENGAGTNMSEPHKWARFEYSTKTVNTDFGNGISSVFGPPNGTVIKVLEKITYADNSATQFLYNGYLQVWSINNLAPNSDELSNVSINIATPDADQADCPRFTQTSTSGQNVATVVTHNDTLQDQPFNLPNGQTLYGKTRIQVWAAQHPNNLRTNTFVEPSGWAEGLPLGTEDCLTTDSTCDGNERVRWSWTHWEQDQVGAFTPYNYPVNPRVKETQVGDDENNVKRTTVSYHQANSSLCTANTGGIENPEDPPYINVACFGLVKEVKIFDANLTTVKKKSVTDYNLGNFTGTSYRSRRIIGLPSQTMLLDPNNDTVLSKVTYAYDETGFVNSQPVSPTQHDSSYGTTFTKRGNLTSTTRCDALTSTPTTCNGGVTSRIKYNTAGSPVMQIDPRGRETEISYTDDWNDNVSRTTYAYPTTITDSGENSSLIEYRFDFGANVWAQSPIPYGGSTTNSIGKTTSRVYENTTGRIARETIENNGAYTRYVYNGNGTALTTYTTIIDTDGTPNLIDPDEVPTETLFDGAGRVRKTRTENPGSVGGYTGKLVEYDTLGRVKRETVPTEINSSWQPTYDDYRGTDVWLWNSSEYDWKGRVTRSIPSDSTGSDGKDTIIAYDGCGCAGGLVTTIQGPVMEAINAVGTPSPAPTPISGRKTQKIREDVLGRTVAIETWTLSGPSLTSTLYSSTTNTYNGRDQITMVDQYDPGTATHQYTTTEYDGHGRPEIIHKPEFFNGTASSPTYITNSYNADDTIATRIDPRGAVTTYTYGNPYATEKRPLVTNISYATPSANPTPGDPKHVPSVEPVTFEYDAAGNRKTMTDGTGSLTYEYDELSRLKKETKDFLDDLPEAPNGGVYPLTYTYHLSGGLKSITDPFNRMTTYSVDAVGRMTAIGAGGSLTTNETAYMSGISYRAFGAVKSMTMRTTNLTTIQMTYDEALRLTGYDANNTANGTSHVQHASYSYHEDGMVSAINNHRDGTQFDQTNVYDFAGRLKKNNVGASGDTFNQAMSYDTFSNLTSRTNYAYSSFLDSFSATFENNRQTSGQSTDTYDAAGNVVRSYQPAVSGGRPYLDTKNWNFDAAGRLAYWDQNGPWENDTHYEYHTYDGDGRAVKKVESENVPWYYIHSSVTGQKITDVLVDGSDGLSRVYMGSTLIHDTTAIGDNISALGFKVTDPISGSTQDILVSGAIPDPTEAPYARNELAGLGTSIPIPPPGSSLLTYFPPFNYNMGYGMGGFAGNAQSGCVDDNNNPIPCSPDSDKKTGEYCKLDNGELGQYDKNGNCKSVKTVTLVVDVEDSSEPTIETFVGRLSGGGRGNGAEGCLFYIGIVNSKTNPPTATSMTPDARKSAREEITRIFDSGGHRVTFDFQDVLDGHVDRSNSYTITLQGGAGEGKSSHSWASGHQGRGVGNLWTGYMESQANDVGNVATSANAIGIAMGRVVAHESIIHNFLNRPNGGHTEDGVTRSAFTSKELLLPNTSHLYGIPRKELEELNRLCHPLIKNRMMLGEH